MNQAVIQLQKYFIDNETVSRPLAMEIMAIALGVRLGCETPMSEYIQELTLEKLTDKVLPFIKEKISKLNEEFVFDTAKTLEVARSVYLHRYYAAYPVVNMSRLRDMTNLTTMVMVPNSGLGIIPVSTGVVREVEEKLTTNQEVFNAINPLLTKVLETL